MKEKKWSKSKIDVGILVKAKVGETEESTREERIRKTSKEVVGYVQAMRGKNNFLV